MKKKMNIVYEDKNLIVVNKPSKLLTVGTDKEREHTLYREASDYVKKQHPKNKVFIVNRLDRDTSGLVVFAKNEVLKKELQDHWNEVALKREYLAIVEGKMLHSKGHLESYLVEEKNFKVHSTLDKKKGVLAITDYEVLDYANTYSLLCIHIHTGRKNQIRVQLSELGHPIIGDKKYGAKRNPLGELGLHAIALSLKVPYLKEPLCLETKVPVKFQIIFKMNDK